MAKRRTFLDRARMFFMESTIRVLRLKQKNLIAITHYRFATLTEGLEIDSKDHVLKTGTVMI